ncbi:MAG: condensation domain-containing protein [Micromonosporaceae bacterium]
MTEQTELTETRLPLTYALQLLSVMDLVHTGGARGPRFVIALGCRLRGAVDEAALAAAIDDLVARHDGLRTVLDGQEQVISPPTPGRFTVVDLATPDPAARAARAEAFLDELDAAEYPADTPPLLWVYLGRLASDDAVLGVVAHHSVTDAWSVDLLVRELADCYAARSAGEEPRLPPAGRYADHVAADLAAADNPRSLAYWERQLDGMPVLSVPADAPRPKGGRAVKAKRRFAVPAELADRLAAVGRQARCTPFITLLTGYAVLLHRLTGETDIGVLTLNSGRGRPEVERLVGYLLNPVPLRFDLAGDPALTECLARVRRTCLDAYRYEIPVLKLTLTVPAAAAAIAGQGALVVPFQHLPSRERTEELPFGPGCTRQGIQRRANRQQEGAALPLDGLWTTQPEASGGLTGTVHYTPDVVAEATARAQVDGYLAVLHQLAADPGRAISQITLPGAYR